MVSFNIETAQKNATVIATGKGCATAALTDLQGPLKIPVTIIRGCGAFLGRGSRRFEIEPNWFQCLPCELPV